MRDLVVVALAIGGAYFGFVRPWVGVLALAMFAYLNPHCYAWGFSRALPVYFVVFSATMLGLVLNGKDRQPFPWTRETVLFVLLLAWFTLTTFWDPDFPDAARTEWVKVIKVYLGIFPTLWLINTKEKLRWLIVVIALSFGLIGLKGGIFALGTGFNYRVWGPPTTFYEGNNEIALALNMMLPLLLLCAREVDNKRAKTFFYVVFFFSICSIISSWSRGGLLALCAVLGAIVLTGRRKWLSIPLLVVAFMVAIPNLPAEWFGRMETIETYQNDTSAMIRIAAWKYAIHRAIENPLTGGGFETWRGATFKDIGVRGRHDVHSAYFEMLEEHGFVAFSVWISLFLGTIVTLERLRRQVANRDELLWVKDYARAIQISLCGYAVGGAFLGVAYWDIFCHLVAIAAVLKVLVRRPVGQVEPVRPVESVKSVAPVVEHGW
jgi:putative inorganic carbon (HCO3(-)) transporter